MDAVIELGFELLDPCICPHTRFDCVHGWVTALVVDLIKALLHGALELVGYLGVSVSVEDTPSLESWLSKHLGLDLAIKLTSTLLDVESIRCTASRRSHDKVSRVVLEASELCWSVLELEMPSLLLLLALLVGCKGGEEILALLDLLVSVGVDNLGEIFHQPEVSTHCFRQTGELAELWDQSDLITSLSVLVDEEWLVRIGDILVVPGLVVLLVADLSAILVESGLWAHTKVETIDPVSLLVVPGDDSRTSYGSLDGLLPVSASLLSLVSQCGDVAEERVCPYYPEGNVDVEQSTSLLHDEPSVKPWPHFDVVSVE